jgi:hypothetical protein
MATSLCKSQEKILLTQLSLILVLHSFPFLQMYLKKLEKSGLKLYLISIAPVIRLSAMSKTHVRTLLLK